MDRGAWWAPVHGVAKSCTQLRIHADKKLLIYLPAIGRVTEF